MQICLLLASGFEEIEAITVVDILRRADLPLSVVGVEQLSVVGAHQITVQADLRLDQVSPQDYAMVILPGGMGGTKVLSTNLLAQELIKTMYHEDKYLAAICAAPLALDAAGVLPARYTCYPGVERELSKKGRVEEKIVWDKKVLTSPGPGTAMDFALAIVQELAGPEKFLQLRKALLI